MELRSLILGTVVLLCSLSSLAGTQPGPSAPSAPSAASPQPPSAEPQADPPLVRRIQAAASKIRGVDLSHMRLLIEDRPTLAAHGWADGRIAITTGLANLLSDDELTAVIAHELGHMIADHHLEPQFALAGQRPNLTVEQTADDLGARLLDSSCLPRTAMVTMLNKVRDAQPACSISRAQLTLRIARLQPATTTPDSAR